MRWALRLPLIVDVCNIQGVRVVANHTEAPYVVVLMKLMLAVATERVINDRI